MKKDIKHQVYNALSDIMFETGASEEDMDKAISWFNEKFYVDANEEDEEND